MRIAKVLAVMVLGSFPASGKSYEADRYNVTLHLDSQGLLTVTETADFHFAAGPFTYVFREIAATETDGIDQVLAWMAGQPCSRGTAPGEVEIHGSSPVVVRWHFAPLVTGNQTFTVQYRAAGTIRRGGDAQTLLWQALPPQRSYRIGASEIVLEYPPDVTPRLVELRSGGPRFEISRGRAAVMLVNFPAQESAVVHAQFGAGSFAGPVPVWPQAQMRRDQDLRRGAGAGTVAAFLFLAVACVWISRIWRPGFPAAGGDGADVLSPPSTLPPALAGWLAGVPNLRVGILLDLARRGVLRIEEMSGRFLGARHFQVVRSRGAAALAPHERALLESVFRSGDSAVRVQDFLTRPSGMLVPGIRSELVAAGLVESTRLRARTRLLAGGALGFGVGLALILLGIATTAGAHLPLAGAGLTVLGAGVVLTALFALMMGVLQSVWSEPGALEASLWKRFAGYLRRIAHGDAELPNPGDMERLLPYTAIFGVMAPILKRQARQGGLALPPWFQAIQTGNGYEDGSLIAFTSACDTATSSGGGDGGAAGASGGGSSGAG